MAKAILKQKLYLYLKNRNIRFFDKLLQCMYPKNWIGLPEMQKKYSQGIIPFFPNENNKHLGNWKTVTIDF